MRHLLSYIILGAIAVFLLLVAAFFAWIRSSQLTITTEQVVAEYRSLPEDARRTAFEWRDPGAGSYITNCRNCHGPEGKGWDQYPGLGDSARLSSRPGGREYMIDLHLYGITSDRWRAPMPAFGTMPDEELAAVINYIIVTFSEPDSMPEEFRFFTPAEVEERRGRAVSASAVNDLRPSPAE